MTTLTTLRFGVLLLLVLASPVSAQSSARSSAQSAGGHLGAVIPLASQPRAYVGEVRCGLGNVPEIAPSDPGKVARHGISSAESVRHEATHLVQLAVNCDSVLARWSAEPLLRLEAEAEATCVGIRAYADTAQRSRRRGEAWQMLAMLYGHRGASGADVYDALERWCRP